MRIHVPFVPFASLIVSDFHILLSTIDDTKKKSKCAYAASNFRSKVIRFPIFPEVLRLTMNYQNYELRSLLRNCTASSHINFLYFILFLAWFVSLSQSLWWFVNCVLRIFVNFRLVVVVLVLPRLPSCLCSFFFTIPSFI